MQTTRTAALRNVALSLTASLLLAAALPQAHAETTATGVSGSQLTRAEVIADLRLWQRAGVDRFVDVQEYGLQTSEYQKAFAEYQRLRNSQAFAEEVARVKAEQGSQHAGR